MDTLGQRIRKIRDMRRLTQKALASKAGISEVALQCYELGTRRPKQEQLIKIAAALDIDVAFLMPCKTDTPMALFALLYDLIDEYGDIEIISKGGQILFGVKKSNENIKLRAAVEAHEKYSVEDFKKWLISYPPKVHNGKIEKNDLF